MVLLGFSLNTGRKNNKAPKLRIVLFGLYFAIVLFKTPVRKVSTVRVQCPTRKNHPSHCGHRLDWWRLSIYWGYEHG